MDVNHGNNDNPERGGAETEATSSGAGDRDAEVIGAGNDDRAKMDVDSEHGDDDNPEQGAAEAKTASSDGSERDGEETKSSSSDGGELDGEVGGAGIDYYAEQVEEEAVAAESAAGRDDVEAAVALTPTLSKQL